MDRIATDLRGRGWGDAPSGSIASVRLLSTEDSIDLHNNQIISNLCDIVALKSWRRQRLWQGFEVSLQGLTVRPADASGSPGVQRLRQKKYSSEDRSLSF